MEAQELMTKTGFLYVNYVNKMVCEEYFTRAQDGLVSNSIDETGAKTTEPTDYKSFEELVAYYDRKSQTILVFNDSTEADALKKLFTALPDFSVESDTEDQNFADELDKSGIFDKEYEVED